MKRLVCLITVILFMPGYVWAASSCVPNSSITEYYLDSRGNPQSQTLTTLTKPVVTYAIFADYHNAEPPCSTKLQNNGTYNCPNWEVPTMVIEGPNPLGSIGDANVNSTIQEFDLRDGSAYSTFGIPSVNPTALTYTTAPSPQWTTISSTMDGTCYKTNITTNTVSDVIETEGVYADDLDLCEANNAECNTENGRTTDEHWVVIAMDNMAIQSLPDVSAEVGQTSRGTCAVIGGSNSGGFETISSTGGSTCPGNQNPN